MRLVSVDQTIDCSELFCPLPTAKARRAIQGLSAGQVLEFIATGEEVVGEVLHWVKQDRHELLRSQQRQDGVFQFLVRKS